METLGSFEISTAATPTSIDSRGIPGERRETFEFIAAWIRADARVAGVDPVDHLLELLDRTRSR